MDYHYLYNKKEVIFILHQLNDEKIKGLLTINRNSINDDFVAQCADIALAYDHLSYREQRVIACTYFFKYTPYEISKQLNITKDQVFYIKRQGLKSIINKLNNYHTPIMPAYNC